MGPKVYGGGIGIWWFEVEATVVLEVDVVLEGVVLLLLLPDDVRDDAISDVGD